MTTVAGTQLRAFVDRIERIEAEIKSYNDDKRDIYAEAKHAGFDLPALRTVIARRRKDPSELSTHEGLVQTYEAALGTEPALRARVHDPNADGMDIPADLRRKRVPA